MEEMYNCDKMEVPVPNHKRDLHKKLIIILKFALLLVTLLFAMSCAIYFQGNGNFRTGPLFTYLALGCTIFLVTTYHVMRGRLLEKYSVKRMRNLRKYAIAKIVVSIVIILVSTIGGLLTNEDLWVHNKYYINNIPGVLGLIFSTMFFFDTKSYLRKLREAQGDATVLHPV
ncbi:hypothetical protein JTE90_027857 [Oedothorax gibbosus]|uniref:Uncharacterized protein n=1 Tax=Oedothorax gibbosus TaxID=931172 RepID=A0AAV6U8V5_9ARAC|nr:hypothetical protein JTE90_027857 [Oedothorax gibbosus]